MSIHILNKDHGKPAGKLLAEAAESFDRKKQRRHEFWILTCYVNLELVESYVDCLLDVVRLTNVYLAFNFSEIYKIGPGDTVEKLDKIQSNLKNKGIEFEWKALASSKLVHSKGYALIQRLDGAVSGGVVLTSSANFTVPGFDGNNIELGYLSTTKKDIQDFENAYDYLWNTLGGDMEGAVFKQESYLFKYALLLSGVFLHKWTGSLSQQVGIRYELTPLAKEKGAIAPELAKVGFEAGDTFTRQVLKLGELPKKEVPRAFIARFTIETYWGRWCPLDAWTTLSKSFEGADQFVQHFREATEKNVLQEIKEDALKTQNDLISKGLIQPVGQEHLDNWVARIDNLRKNNRFLERFFTGYEAHDFPYTIEQESDVLELFGSLKEAIELSRVKNIAKDKVVCAIGNADPKVIRLSDNERQIIRRMHNGT